MNSQYQNELFEKYLNLKNFSINERSLIHFATSFDFYFKIYLTRLKILKYLITSNFKLDQFTNNENFIYDEIEDLFISFEILTKNFKPINSKAIFNLILNYYIDTVEHGSFKMGRFHFNLLMNPDASLNNRALILRKFLFLKKESSLHEITIKDICYLFKFLNHEDFLESQFFYNLNFYCKNSDINTFDVILGLIFQESFFKEISLFGSEIKRVKDVCRLLIFNYIKNNIQDQNSNAKIVSHEFLLFLKFLYSILDFTQNSKSLSKKLIFKIDNIDEIEFNKYYISFYKSVFVDNRKIIQNYLMTLKSEMKISKKQKINTEKQASHTLSLFT